MTNQFKAEGRERSFVRLSSILERQHPEEEAGRRTTHDPLDFQSECQRRLAGGLPSCEKAKEAPPSFRQWQANTARSAAEAM